MRRIQMPGLAEPVTQLALGTAFLRDEHHATEMLDADVDAGGNLVATAWVYRAGEAERLLGEWLERSGRRAGVQIITKGAHSPLCKPETVAPQLDESLERLRTDHVELYFVHRDEPAFPAGAFVDAMAAELEAGRIGSYGFSNWSRERIDEAVAYAKAERLPLPTAISNNFSLADMVAPVWEGVMAANGPQWRERLMKGDLGLYAWSAQARGFFTDRADPTVRSDPDLVRCWYSDANLERRRRAYELAEARGVTANQIALAWSLSQKFPLVAIVGPLTPHELADSIAAASVELSDEEIAWLAAP
jgi:aryl-alcohol dehydrogenase-like predicted oxidoreductase